MSPLVYLLADSGVADRGRVAAILTNLEDGTPHSLSLARGLAERLW